MSVLAVEEATGAGVLVVELRCVAGGARVTFGRAGMSNGRRYLSGYLDAEGRIGGCRFRRLFVEVAEPHWGGPGEWHVRGSRVPVGARGTTSLTDAASAKLAAEVEGQVRAVGFDEAWQAAFRQSRRGDALAAAEEAGRVAHWWLMVEATEAHYGVGMYGVEMLVAADQPPNVDVVERGRIGHEDCAGRVLTRSGRQVGWVTMSGRLVPTAELAPLRSV